MASLEKQTCYEGHTVQSFQFYLQHSGEHEAMLQCVHSVVAEEFKRIGAGKSGLDILGVGSGGGEMDVQMLSLLQSTFPAVPITADVVEGSSQLSDKFKALVVKTANLQKIPFTWHVMKSEHYEKQVKVMGDAKKFDFVHMIQMLYYMDDLADTLKFYHSLLKNNGRLMIIVEIAGGGWDVLWRTFHAVKEYRSSDTVKACLDRLGLKYEEHIIPNAFDITECFDPRSLTGKHLLNFMTVKEDFHKSFTQEIRDGVLELLKNKCSTETNGRIFFNSTLSCILVHP